MWVFVMGGSGVLGQVICMVFVQVGYEVWVYVNCYFVQVEVVVQQIVVVGGVVYVIVFDVIDVDVMFVVLQLFIDDVLVQIFVNNVGIYDDVLMVGMLCW